jgi:hypothetical protein
MNHTIYCVAEDLQSMPTAELTSLNSGDGNGARIVSLFMEEVMEEATSNEMSGSSAGTVF